MSEEDSIELFESKPPDWKLVVKVSTSYWHDKRGVHMRKDCLFLKRRSFGFNILQEDCSNIGAEEVLPRILNLNEVEDGIWELFVVNEQMDWETGNVEEYDYMLFPYVEESA